MSWIESQPADRPGPRAGWAVRFVPGLAAALVIALTVSLGSWQLRRADEKRALQQAQDAAGRAPALAVGAVPLPAAALEGRRVRLTGQWVAPGTVFLDNRTYRGRAGFFVFTPLRLDGDAPIGRAPMHVLVLRGWVERDPADRTRLPALATPAGRVELEGLAQMPPPDVRPGSTLAAGGGAGGSDAPGEGEGGRLWQAVTLARYAAWSGLALQPVIVRQASGTDDALVRDWPSPGSGADKHLGYAVQWYAMAAATGLLWLYFGLIKGHGKSDSNE